MKTVAIVDQEAQQREAVQKVKRKPSLSERAKEATKNLMNKVLPPKKWPFNHPHINPHYREGNGVGRWMPHNGAREKARRMRQMERAYAGA